MRRRQFLAGSLGVGLSLVGLKRLWPWSNEERILLNPSARLTTLVVSSRFGEAWNQMINLERADRLECEFKRSGRLLSVAYRRTDEGMVVSREFVDRQAKIEWLRRFFSVPGIVNEAPSADLRFYSLDNGGVEFTPRALARTLTSWV